jgi:putative endopeptidase
MLRDFLQGASAFACGALLLVPPAPAQSAAAPASSAPPAASSAALHAFDPALLDRSADPCTDFYQFACGGWTARNPIPADRAAWGRDGELEQQNSLLLKSILEEAAGKTSRTPAEQKIGDAYHACMDTGAIDAAGTEPLKPILAEIDAIADKAALPALLAHLQILGDEALFSFGSQQDALHANQEIAGVGQPALGLPEKGFYDRADARSAQLRAEYSEHIVRMFTLLGEGHDQAARDGAAALRIETALAAASMSEVEMRDPHRLYHRTPLVQFAANSPAFDFPLFLRSVGTPPIELLNVEEPTFFLSLNELLTSTPLDDLKSYLKWTVVRRVPGTALPAAFDAEDFAFFGKALEGQPEQQPRWRRCVARVDDDLGEALGQVFVARRFSAQDKARTVELAHEVEAAMGRELDALPWMSTPTREQAHAKLAAVANKVGYPDHWRDYSALTIAPEDALGNAQRAAGFRERRDLSKIGRTVDRAEWMMSPPTVNAYYNPQTNDVNFPAGILQPPYYDSSQDNAVNYGSIGAVIGHELTHGFDDEGRQFDAEGNLRDWWRKRDATEFNRRAECVADEYSGFTAVDELHVNGKLTLGENLADLGGLRLAYLAWLDQAVHGPSKPAEGAAYGGLTPEQQFFAAYGQSWCESRRPQNLRTMVQTDPHAPERFRVNGVVQNMPEFQKAWSCHTGQPMAPAKRCSVW